MDTKGKILQRLRYVPTILWVILAFLVALGVAAYVTQDDTQVADDTQNEATTENGNGDANQEVAGQGESNGTDSEQEDESSDNGEGAATTDGDEELPNELAAAGPAEDVAVMVAVTSTLGVIYLGSRKRLQAEIKK